MQHWAQAENWAAAARDIITICQEARRQQTRFLELLGLTWPEARGLPERDKAILQFAWESYRASTISI
jgi:hypothetical protein